MYSWKAQELLSGLWIAWLGLSLPLLFFSGTIQFQVLCCSEGNIQLLAGSKTPLGEVDPSVEEEKKKTQPMDLAQEASEKKQLICFLKWKLLNPTLHTYILSMFCKLPILQHCQL